MPDVVLGTGDPRMAKMQRREGEASTETKINMGGKCLRGMYKVLWERRAASQSVFPGWRSLKDFTELFQLGLVNS